MAILEQQRAAQPWGEDQLFHQLLIGPIRDRPLKPPLNRIRQCMIVRTDVKEPCVGIGQQQIRIQGGAGCGRRHQLFLPLQLRNASGEQLHPLVIHQAKQVLRSGSERSQARRIKDVHITPAHPLEQSDVAEVLLVADRGQPLDLTPMGPTAAESEDATSDGNGHGPQTPVQIHASAIDTDAQGKGIAA